MPVKHDWPMPADQNIRRMNFGRYGFCLTPRKLSKKHKRPIAIAIGRFVVGRAGFEPT